MASTEEWIGSALAAARSGNPNGSQAVWRQLEGLLRGEFAQRAFTAKELAAAAGRLGKAADENSPDGAQ